MSLKEKINTEIKNAMKAKDSARLTALRSIKSMILLAETEGGRSGDLSEADENKLLMKAAKQRKDSAALYEEQGRDDLLATEKAELAVIEGFLPKMMDTTEIETAIGEIIEKTGASGMKDIGKVMGMAMKSLAGKADGSEISAAAKKLLNG